MQTGHDSFESGIVAESIEHWFRARHNHPVTVLPGSALERCDGLVL
jgi:hypothetical protein